MKKRACVFSCLLCLMIFLNGCVRSGTKRELEALAVVMGIAMDKMDEKSGPESERLLLTAQVVRNIAISQNSSQSEGGGSASEGDLSKPYWNVQVTGTDLLEALRSAVHITNRRPLRRTEPDSGYRQRACGGRNRKIFRLLFSRS